MSISNVTANVDVIVFSDEQKPLRAEPLSDEAGTGNLESRIKPRSSCPLVRRF